MAGALTFAKSDDGLSTIEDGVTRHAWAWTSDASGDVSGISVTITPGTIVAVTFLPGAGGSQPTNLYDVTLMCDEHGPDVLNDEGLNLSNTAGSHHAVFIYNSDKTAHFRQWMHGGGYTLNVANAGASKSGTMALFQYRGVL